MVTTSPYTREPMFALGVPRARRREAGWSGVVAGGIESARLDALLARATGGVGGVAYLVDDGGRVLSRPQAGRQAPFADRSGDAPVAALLAGGAGAVGYRAGGDARLAGYAPVPGLGWGVVVEAPEAMALAQRPRRHRPVVRRPRAGHRRGGPRRGRTHRLGDGAARRRWCAQPRGSPPGAPAPTVALPRSGVAEVARLTAAFADMRDRLAARAADRERAERARADLIREHAAREAALERSARLRALHEATLTVAAAAPTDAEAVAALLVTAMQGAVATVAAQDGALVLAEDPAWGPLVPESDPEAGADSPRPLGAHRARAPCARKGPSPTSWPPGSSCPCRTPCSRSRPCAVRARPDGEDGATDGRAAATGEPRPSRFGPFPHLAERGVRAFALVPLSVGGRVLGALAVNFARPGRLREGRPGAAGALRRPHGGRPGAGPPGGGAPDRPAGPGGAGGGGGRPARAGPAEERVPVHHLPRAAHAADRGARLRPAPHRAGAGPRPRRRGGPGPAHPVRLDPAGAPGAGPARLRPPGAGRGGRAPPGRRPRPGAGRGPGRPPAPARRASAWWPTSPRASPPTPTRRASPRW